MRHYTRSESHQKDKVEALLWLYGQLALASSLRAGCFMGHSVA